MGRILPKPADFECVMGPDCKASVDGEPCGNWTFDKCGIQSCKFSHAMKTPPSKAVVEGMVKRFQEKVDEFVAGEAAKNSQGE